MRSRAWLLCAIGWLAFAFLQAPGLSVADTKLDLIQNPWGFLSQALQPWTEVFPLGQLQNQAYGYLFPHGLFFALFSWLPAWVTQRLWWALLLFLAFAGMVQLLEKLPVGNNFSRILAGMLFALSPRVLTTLGAISSEAWVCALAPWVLLPLVDVLRPRAGAGTAADAGASDDSTADSTGRALSAEDKVLLRRAALRSAVAALCMGAVNAVATAVAILPAVIFWLAAWLRRDSRGQVAYFSRWWVPAGLAVCFWWVGPLLILGRYSPPFTDYIESSSLTTRWLNLLENLRGTTSWVPFLSSERVAGAALVSEPVFILATLAVALLGLWGLARRDLPAAGVWLSMLGVGLAALGVAVDPFSLLSGGARSFLDGAGAALRNLHKFDVLVRLPLMVGVAHALAHVRVPGRDRAGMQQWRHPEKNPHVVKVFAAVLLTVLATAPGWSGRIAPADGFRGVPQYWRAAADWLNENSTQPEDGRVMLLPQARFGRQTWGNTRDEPAQPLLDVPWVVRDSVPLVQPDAIRGLDGIQREVHSGQPLPTLAATLRSQGVGHVLVRTDLTVAADTPGAHSVLRTLRRSGGFREVAAFGDEKAPEVRIFAVTPKQTGGDAPQPAGGLREIAAEQVEVIHAGPEALPRLDAADRALGRTDTPRVRVLHQQLAGTGMGADAFAERGPQTLTDTPARRDHNYGNVTNADSEIRAPKDSTRVLNPVRDYPLTSVAEGANPANHDEHPLTEVRTTGGAVRASSTAADPTGFGGADTRRSLTAAVDGNPDTAWYPSPGRAIGQYLELELDKPHRGLSVSLLTQGADARIHAESFRSDAGDSPLGSTTVTVKAGEATRIAIPGGRGDRVRLQLLGSFSDVGFSEVEVFATDGGGAAQDVTPRRVPTVPALDGSSARYLNRFVFGQEVPEHSMVREFTVPEHLAGQELVLHTAGCENSSSRAESAVVTVDGEDYRCGEKFSLSEGRHRLATTARWAALSVAEPLYAEAVSEAPAADALPVVSQDGGSGGDDRFHLGYSSEQRVVFLPSNANPGRVATLHVADPEGSREIRLHPMVINGWQQGWVVPAGVSGTIALSFAATGFYQAWLAAGLVLALAVVLAWALAERRARQVGSRAGIPAAAAVGASAHSSEVTAAADEVSAEPADEAQAEASAAAHSATPLNRAQRGAALLATVALAFLLAGIPGLMLAVVLALLQLVFARPGIQRWAEQHPILRSLPTGGVLRIVAGSGAFLAAVFAAQGPWTGRHYAGDSWVLQLALLAVVLAVYFAHILLIPTRAGSSTKA
ncbi:DUF3367 domain-containing protein [Corynebacterium sp. UMB9976]|uniref:DUF3367 domain-containing protein n=1 Tax=Corynebacterium sp. UMB9976 TaxID=3046354 RepID=UPI00254F7935|nr:DUF3367 domain-containing protein [Corynebacterium sp. UMB9976]MDK6301914.1 DUF3367 domain-containing protein [Corynebacterium sp. UMB9976]